MHDSHASGLIEDFQFNLGISWISWISSWLSYNNPENRVSLRHRVDISNFIVNIAVNGDETNSIVTFAENSNDSISTGNPHLNPEGPRGSAPCRIH